MKLLLLLLSVVVLCHGTDTYTARLAPSKDYCEMGCENGDCIADHGTFNCSCYGNWFGDNCTQHICSKVLEDGEAPLCQNEGICLTNPSNISDYLCSCPLGYTGRNCQYVAHGDACSSNPCSGNGTCYNLASGDFECICHPGTYGTTCNYTNNDVCTQQYVENCFGNGECEIIQKNGAPFPLCHCYGDFDGSTKCKFRQFVDTCRFENPCQNGGICSYVKGGLYSCECPANKTGINCTEDFNVCEPNPCGVNGTCNPAFAGHYYNCSCPDNRKGYNCEYIVDPCLGRCGEGETCVIRSPPESNGWYSTSVETECLGGCESHDHCSSSPCGAFGTCTSTDTSYECECQSGYTGRNCSSVDHCSTSPCSPSHSTACVNHPKNSSAICVCSPGWGGDLCDKDIDECLSGLNRCNGGRCVNRPGGYSCENCPPNTTGTNCERYLTCADMICVNGGTCSDSGGFVNCTCPEGFTGTTCESQICPRQEHCDSVAGNGICDYNCYTAACSFDGGDRCTLNPNSTNPWASCRREEVCRSVYKDGECNVECNTKECLYDGGDCLPTCPTEEACIVAVGDGQCSPECSTQECPYDHIECGGNTNFLKDELVFILATSREMPFSDPYRAKFLEILGNLTNTIPSVIESKVITQDELRYLAMKHPVNFNIIIAQGEDILIYLVRLRLDVRLCRASCPTSVEDVIKIIEANYESDNPKIGTFAPVSVYDQPPPENNPTPGLSNIVIGVIGGVVVLVISVVIVALVLGKRKIRAKIWRPHSPASESDTASTSHGTDGRRRGSQAGGTVTGMEPSGLQHSDSDEFMQKGAKKAKMLPNGTSAHIEYVPVDGRYELVQDSRQWNPAHYEALRNPRRVHDLLLGYKQQHGENLDVNAAGPGGYTPLMLVVMKRHSSHENIPYNSRTSSVSSEHQVYTAPYCTPYHDRMALMNGAAAGGRPISNGSMLSHDGCFYTPHGFIPPIESSVATLLKSNVDLNATNDFGQTALHLAAACSRADYVEQLLEAGANPNIGDNWGQSALQVAIGAVSEGSFMILINHPKTDLNLKSDGGITPLMAAVKVVNQYMLKLLIKKSADIAATDNDGRTALHWAAMVDNLEALKLLIRHGPETIKDAQDNKGQTALFLACREGSYGCVKHLIDCFANATLLDNLDQSPVQIAMQKQHLDIVALLQTQGPISYPPRVNIPYRPPGGHLEQEPMYPYPATSRPLIKPFKSKSRQEHRNLTDHSVGLSFAQQPYFSGAGGMPSTSHDPSQQTFRDVVHLPISTDPSSIPMSVLGQSSYSNAYSSGAAAAVASVSPVTSTVPHQPPVDGGSPPTCMGANSVVNTHPVMANYLMSNSDQLQQSTTPPSQYASPQSAGYGNPSPGYDSELPADFIGGSDPTTATSSAAGVMVSQSQLSPQSYNHLPSTSSIVSSSQQLPSYNSRFTSYNNGMEQHSTAPPVSAYGSSGSTMPLKHLPYVAETSMSHPSAGGGPTPLVSSDQTYHHRTSPPHMGSVSSGSPSSAYPSPLQPSNELHTNFIHNGYAYSASSRTSPPSLTPSPESREGQLVNAHGTFHVEHHAQDYPSCHTHIPADSGMTMV